MQEYQNTRMMCPYCGGGEQVIGKQSGYGTVRANRKFSLREQPIYHVICLQCGAILKSYVKQPQKLL